MGERFTFNLKRWKPLRNNHYTKGCVYFYECIDKESTPLTSQQSHYVKQVKLFIYYLFYYYGDDHLILRGPDRESVNESHFAL